MSKLETAHSSAEKTEISHHEDVDKADLNTDEEIMQDVQNHELSMNQLLKKYPVPNWSSDRIKLYLTMICVYFVSTSNGYDSSLLTSINTLKEYHKHFNLSGSPASTGLVFSIYPIGAMCSTLFVWLGDYIGRPKTISIGLILVIVGAVMSATTSNFHVFIGARFILSQINIATAIAPAYMMEICPPNIKTLALFYNTFYLVGSIIATWTMYGTSIHYAGTQKSFSIGLWMQILCPGIVLLNVFLMPESPRYLYSKGDIDKCRTFIVKYHAGGDENHPIVDAELAQIAESFKDGILKPKDYFDWRVFIKTKAKRRRTALLSIWAWMCQFSGNQVVGYYMTTLFLNLGIKNATTRLLLTAVNSIISLCFGLTGSYFTEKVGRRAVLLCANAGFVICFAVMTGAAKAFEDNPDNKKASSVGIAFIYIFGACFFSFAFTPLQPIYPAELASNDMRARGMALWHLVSNAASTLNLYTAPLAMQNIKHYYYLVYVFWDFCQFLLVYFFFVETSNLSLEEIEYVFDQDHPVKESIRLSKAAREGRSAKTKNTSEQEAVSQTV